MALPQLKLPETSPSKQSPLRLAPESPRERILTDIFSKTLTFAIRPNYFLMSFLAPKWTPWGSTFFVFLTLGDL